MIGKSAPHGDRTVAFMDVGTNSVRLLVVGVEGNRSYKILRKEKEMIRLGEGGLVDQMIQPEGMDRAVLVCGKFAEVAASFGAEDIMVIATSATREALNQYEFVNRIKEEAGLEVRVVSGLEEARLIYLGVSRSNNIGERQTLFIDIGGGSTELIVGDENQYQYVGSLQLGAIRLTNLFFLPDETGPVTSDRYKLLLQHVYNRAIRAIQQIQTMPFEIAIGSSGTIENLADIATRMFHDRRRTRDDVLTYKHLKEVVKKLGALSLEERCEVPGINPKRADIIIAGAAILEKVMHELKVKELHISDRGVQDGLLVDYLASQKHDLHARPISVRERSVLNLGRACNFDESHAKQVAGLAVEMFDTAGEAGLHKLGERERELLQFSAILHDIGLFLSYPQHAAHAAYMIRNAEMVGFDLKEIEIMASTALYHRKRSPSKKHEDFAAMDKRDREVVRILSMLLRLAESLDRSHTNAVEHARINIDNGDAVLALQNQRECQLEVWNTRQQAESFKKTFGHKLVIRAEQDSDK